MEKGNGNYSRKNGNYSRKNGNAYYPNYQYFNCSGCEYYYHELNREAILRNNQEIQLALMNRNIEKMTEQIKLVNSNINKLISPPPSNIKNMDFSKSKMCDDPTMVIQIDDLSQLGSTKKNDPLGILGSIFTLVDTMGKKPSCKPGNSSCSEDSNVEDSIDPPEFGIDEKFDELDIKIETIDDLITLGQKYETPENGNNKDIPIGVSYINGKKYNIDFKILNNLVNPLTKLKSMIGLETVKSSIIDMILYYIQNFEAKGNNMLHTTIEGPPGVGKTELGKIMAEIYAGLGVIKSNKFKLVKRSDLVGEYLGHTAPKTQKVIDEADGGVLFIDEAYALGNEEKKDSFSKECIDVINQNLSENKKKFICIIAGYPDELQKCFFSYNEGLERRFPFRFRIDGYTPEELKSIFLKKVGDLKWKLCQEVNNQILDQFFTQNKDAFKYYGGDIDNLLLNCKFVHSRRVFGSHPVNKKKLTIEDIGNGFKRFVKNRELKNDNSYISHIYS